MQPHTSTAGLDATTLRQLLDAIGRRMAEAGMVAEIAVYGGAALILTFEDNAGRLSTRDIDFVGIEGDLGDLVAVADEVGLQHDLPPGWFNDAVAMFTADRPDYQFFGDFPAIGEHGLRVFTASPEYILAMKIMAMRSALEAHDILDVWKLLEILKINSYHDAMDTVEKFFPDEPVPERNAALLADIIEARRVGASYDPMHFW